MTTLAFVIMIWVLKTVIEYFIESFIYFILFIHTIIINILFVF